RDVLKKPNCIGVLQRLSLETNKGPIRSNIPSLAETRDHRDDPHTNTAAEVAAITIRLPGASELYNPLQRTEVQQAVGYRELGASSPRLAVVDGLVERVAGEVLTDIERLVD